MQDFIWEYRKPLLFFILIPGFIIYRLVLAYFPTRPLETSRAVYEVVFYGLVNFTIYYATLSIIREFSATVNKDSWWFIGVFTLVTPIIIPQLLFRILNSKVFKSSIYNINPTPWDSFFSMNESKYMIVYFNNGSKIGGYYGERSFATSYPEEREIYLETEWEINDKDEFVKLISSSNGVIINCAEINYIKFYQ